MPDFKAKIHPIRFRLGLRPRPRWGAYTALLQTSSWIKVGEILLRAEKGGKRGRN